jgi:cell division protein FtsL
MKFFKTHKLNKIILLIVLIYAVCHFITGAKKLDSYNAEKAYYEDQIASLNEEKEELIETKENMNSPEYIEEIAREKLDMYLPNERVYIDVAK